MTTEGDTLHAEIASLEAEILRLKGAGPIGGGEVEALKAAEALREDVYQLRARLPGATMAGFVTIHQAASRLGLLASEARKLFMETAPVPTHTDPKNGFLCINEAALEEYIVKTADGEDPSPFI